MALSEIIPKFEERRRDRRIQVDQGVAFLLAGSWHGCRIVNVSRGGAAIVAEQRPAVDKEIVVSIPQLGYFKCRVLRHSDEGFAVRFEAADFGLEPSSLGSGE